MKENHHHDGILLSGGLDSSILAYHTRPKDSITIIVDKSSPDYSYSSLIAKKKYSINHHKIITSFEEILSNIEELIQDFKTFDPIFLKNSVVQLIGFKTAKKLKINSVVLGDGADELFAGYNFLQQYINEPNKINQKIDSIIQNMDFISIKLAKKLGLKIFLPFLEKEIVEFSHNITFEEKISNYNGILFGKFFLRKCYEYILGKEIVWRRKTALENGSGVTNLQYYINTNLVTDYDYIKEIKKAKLEEGVEIRNKEHLYFYKIYRKFFKPPIEEKSMAINNNKIEIEKCPYCNTIFIWDGNFCKVCGAFPVYFNHNNDVLYDSKNS
ncbi:MAG: asparagine synthase-related protein [Candidatus Nitrosocosmicus sp.]